MERPAACVPRSEQDLLSPCEPCVSEDQAGETTEEPRSPTRLNLVLEGGGLRGVALVGAVAALTEAIPRRRLPGAQETGAGSRRGGRTASAERTRRGGPFAAHPRADRGAWRRLRGRGWAPRRGARKGAAPLASRDVTVDVERGDVAREGDGQLSVEVGEEVAAA